MAWCERSGNGVGPGRGCKHILDLSFYILYLDGALEVLVAIGSKR